MNENFKFEQNNSLKRCLFYGASIGTLIGLFNFLGALSIATDPSGAVVYIFFIYFPSFIIGLPWSLISIFTEGPMLKASIISIGSILNGLIIGAAYGFLKSSD